MKVIPYRSENNPYDFNSRSTFISSNILVTPTYESSPRVSCRKNVTHTKSRIFPDRYIHKYDVPYQTTNSDEYDHPKIKEKYEKLRLPSLNAYSSSDEPNKGFVKRNSPKNSNKTREISKEKSVLVGKVYAVPFNNNSHVINTKSSADWNNPTKQLSTLNSL
jgi:hypothetical protein